MSWPAIAGLACVYVGVGLAFCITFLRPHIGVAAGNPQWRATTQDDMWRGGAVLGLLLVWPPIAIVWVVGRLAR